MHHPKFSLSFTTKNGWPHGFCSLRGDLGCMANHARVAYYRVEGIADFLAVTPRELRRVFKDSLGIAVKDWLVQVRSVEVRNRLREDSSIKEIAVSVGFSHPKELSREFKKVYGLSPSDYRSRERTRAAKSQEPRAKKSVDR